jgi:tight adherence protein C
MMSVTAITANGDLIVGTMAAMSVFFASIAVCWPYLVPDPVETRLRRLAGVREAIRLSEAQKLTGAGAIKLNSEPRRIFERIFDRLNLAREAEDSELVPKLRMAGYRGRGPVPTFLAMRLLVPLTLLAIIGPILFVVAPPSYPPLMKLSIMLGAAFAGYRAPAMYVASRISRRQRSIRRAWPDALDLLLLCVESGMGIEGAFRKAAQEIGLQSTDLAEELALTTAELTYLPDRRTAYQNLAKRTGIDCVKAIVTCLMQAEQHGTALGPSLRIFAKEQRDQRLLDAEKKAASLPPKLTVVLIVFFMPVLLAVITAPAVIQTMHGR